MGQATLFLWPKDKIIYHFSAWKRVLNVISYFRLSSRTRLSCVAGAALILVHSMGRDVIETAPSLGQRGPGPAGLRVYNWRRQDWSDS